jgi:hypothetical protein
MAYAGYRQYLALPAETKPWLWHPLELLFRSIQLLPMQYAGFDERVPWTLQVARFLLPALAIYAAVKAVAALYVEQVRALGLRFLWRNHVVVCGLGERGLAIVRRLREAGRSVVAIELDRENHFLAPCRETGAVAIIGDARDRQVLQRARLRYATHLIATCGEDSVNAGIAATAQGLSPHQRGGALTCGTEIRDPDLCRLMHGWELSGSQSPRFRLQLINVHDQGARAVLNEYPPVCSSRGCLPHFLTVGIGRMGESLLVEASRRWWVANRDSDRRIRASVVDLRATEKVRLLRMQYPKMDAACDLNPIDVDVRSPEFHRLNIFTDQAERGTVNAAYVCLDNDSLAITTALVLARLIGSGDVAVVVRTSYSGGLTGLLRGIGDTKCASARIRPFGLLDRTCDPALLLSGNIELLGQAFHAQWMSARLAEGRTLTSHPGIRPWHDLPEELREANRAQAACIGDELSDIHCRIAPLVDWDADRFEFTGDEIERMARREHERWVTDRQAAGWSHAPGEVDFDRRTHPSLTDWASLPAGERDKDRRLVRSFPVHLAEVGLQIERVDALIGERESDGRHSAVFTQTD